MPSAIFLEEAARKIASLGGRIVNVDSSLLAERPKIVPHVPAMKAHIAKALGLQPAQVGVKATTNERLGFVGREEGMAAYAVACVEIKD